MTINADGYIYLSLNGISVSFTWFNTSGEFPRLFGDLPAPELNPWGNISVLGNPYGNPEKWDFEAIGTIADCQALCRIYREYLYLTYTRQDSKILLIDATRDIEERSPRTRAAAPSPFDTVTTNGGYVTYYGQYYVLFSAQPEGPVYWGSDSGNDYWSVKVRLLERSERVTP